MTEFIYHALGICGDHWHPNFINISFPVLIVALTLKSIKNKKLEVPGAQ